MRKLKVYVVGDQTNYANFITKDYSLVKTMNEADIIIFTGGEDVSPEIYGEQSGEFTNSNLERDEYEASEFGNAKKLNRLIIGICRGAQFLTTMNNGRLIQHVTNHASGPHKIFIPTENRHIQITSTHHQMMWPYNLRGNDYSIIAHADGLSSKYLNGFNEDNELPENFVEPEIVYYPKTNCLCIQGHPEYMDKKSDAVKFINLLIDDLLVEESNYTYIDKIDDQLRADGRIVNQPLGLGVAIDELDKILRGYIDGAE